MPSSVRDRLTNSYEPVFFLTKSKRYFFDLDAVRVPHAPSFHIRYRGKYTGSYAKNKYTSIGYKEADQNRKLPAGGKNPGDVWTIATQPAPPEVRGKHFARFPDKLIEPMILAGCPAQGIVLDPFMGSGTTAVVAKKLGRNFIGIELNPEYVALATERVNAIKPQNKLF